MKTYKVYTADGNTQTIKAKGMTIDEDGLLILRVQREGGVVAAFAKGSWAYFIVTDDGTNE
jgi:hypothetical protein